MLRASLLCLAISLTAGCFAHNPAIPRLGEGEIASTAPPLESPQPVLEAEGWQYFQCTNPGPDVPEDQCRDWKPFPSATLWWDNVEVGQHHKNAAGQPCWFLGQYGTLCGEIMTPPVRPESNGNGAWVKIRVLAKPNSGPFAGCNFLYREYMEGGAKPPAGRPLGKYRAKYRCSEN